MRKRRFIFITLILTFLIAAPITIGGLLLPAQYQDTFMGELPFKFAHLSESSGKRIIIVGGSGMAFAIDSELIEEYFPGYTAVNMGMYADLGTKLILDLTESELREGDIVIIAPEQHAQAMSDYIGGQSALQGFDGAWYLPIRLLSGSGNIFTDLRLSAASGGSLFYNHAKDLGSLIGALPSFSAEKWRYVLTGNYPEGDGIYKRSSFNEYGDIDSSLAAANTMPDLFDPDTPVSYSAETMSSDFADTLSTYAAAAASRGAEVYFAFCPANRLALTGDASPDAFYEYLYGTLNFTILGDPCNAVMDAEWFFDTNFHLNQSGRTVYTRQLIRDLKAAMGITSPTDIMLPEKPSPDGFSEEEGFIVTSDLWAGDEEITSITLPENTVRIEDYAFCGCTALKEIHLKGTHPSQILIGEHLLDGTPAVICVPAGTLSAYRTDYRFSRYASRIFEEER